MVPPRSRVENRYAVDRVLGLSSHARAWLGSRMVRKGKKRAVAQVNPQKKKMNKGIWTAGI